MSKFLPQFFVAIGSPCFRNIRYVYCRRSINKTMADESKKKKGKQLQTFFAVPSTSKTNKNGDKIDSPNKSIVKIMLIRKKCLTQNQTRRRLKKGQCLKT